MGDLLGSLIKPDTIIIWWLNWEQYWLERDQGCPVEGIKPDKPVGERYKCLYKFYTNKTMYINLSIHNTFISIGEGEHMSYYPWEQGVAEGDRGGGTYVILPLAS